ncbi:hypothetical protein [Gordonia sp. (in: high G+C Gram-positive bacteria)]|uniref:hypothetical protein n=1 Tax=Gordonia sp. (in: high G+C Gram-positive bacteria) TaxID=84139 RepID=UPI00260708A8|nr:hypothetical protein [Gordonia sp. (in: high G+C Gram-positive bacteria)]
MPTSSDAPLLPRLRAGAVGGTVAGTGIAAHAQGHGCLPGSGGLLLVAAIGVGLGVVAGRPGATSHTASAWRLLPLLGAGQLMVHLALIALTGHHHDLITAPMAATHTLGALLALGLVVVAETLVRAATGLARRVVALVCRRPIAATGALVVVAYDGPRIPSLRRLGTAGTRGPPLHV